MGKILSVTGMPGSGKTTFAVNLACGLAERDKIVILLAAELNYGTLQSFFGTTIEDGKGIFASLSDKTEQPEKMLTQCNKINDNIYLMGIPNENYDVHTDGLEDLKVDQLLRRLSMISDYLIIDCTSDLYNGITIMGIEKADHIYCLYKSVSNAAFWHRSWVPVLMQLSDVPICPIITEHQLGCDPNTLVKAIDIEPFAFLPNVPTASILENMGTPIFLEKRKIASLFSFNKKEDVFRYQLVIKNIVDALIIGKDN
ncbi:AAA family ATPase [Aminipila butyrica]|uniref:AAA family ATPase n=1 Tax=Aminipila butyrica TaxID=433296 RepID=A0A858BX77_9FIRM|nr:AAA family ATPase [Aminipila butyrica]QIB69779.1 AAA family ATPase [Aminipila butyrica]